MVRQILSRRAALRSGGAVGVASLAGCLGGGDTVTIGMCNSQTGSLDTFGDRNQRGKQLAVEDVNATGLRGGDLEIIEEDTQSNPGPGVSAAQKLVNQNEVPLIVGAVSSSVSLAIYDSVVSGSEVDQISQNSTSPDLSQFPDLMRMSPPGRAQASAIADLVSQGGHGSVAVSFVNNAYGKGVSDVFREFFDGEVAYFEAHAREKSSYSNVVTAMGDSGADAWVFVTYQPEFTTIGKEAFDQGYSPPLYGADSVKGPDVVGGVPGEFLEGMKVVVPSAALTQDNYQTFASRFNEEFDKDPTSWATYAYDAIVTAALALEAADEVSAAAIPAELIRDVTRSDGQTVFSYEAAHDVLADGGGPTDVDYQGISGPIDLDENGDPRAFLQVFRVADGAYEAAGTIKGE
jgi:branched-chain amino acid transport system substrate-binding protein